MKKQILLGLVCIGMAGSCKKKDDDISPQPAAKQLISAVTSISGRTVSYQLLYDSKNRLTEYKSLEDEYKSKVTYDAKDNPVKFEIESDGTRQVFDVKYGDNGIPTGTTHQLFDPEKPGEVTQTQITYEISGGKIGKMKISDGTGVSFSYLLTYAGNNLTRITNDAGELILGWKHGSKKSPYSSGRFKYPVVPDLFPLFSSENEIIETTIFLPEYGLVVFKDEYEYDADGYPTSSVTKDDEGGLVQRTEFRYR